MILEKANANDPRRLYLQIADILEKNIRNNDIKVGQRIPPIRKLHKQFGVGLDTMKGALAKLENEGYISRIRKRGTFVISSEPGTMPGLREGGLVAFVYCGASEPLDPSLSTTYHMITEAVERKIRERKQNLIYRVLDGNALDFNGLKKDITGMIVSGFLTAERIKAIKDTGIPFVLLGDPYEKGRDYPGLDIVTSDDFQKTYLAAKHLAGLGHRKILYVSRSTTRYSWEIDMLEGYREALKQAGIEYDGRLVLEPEDFDEDSSYRVMSAFLGSASPFTGIICAGNAVYRGVIKAMDKKNISVPGGASVVVCGNIRGATGVDFDLNELSSAAVALLYEKLSVPNNAPAWQPKRITVPYRLREGGTTKRLDSGGL